MSAEMPARIRLYAREWGEVRPGDDPADFPNTVEFVRADIADGLLEALLKVAPSHQGGHSTDGMVIADVLAAEFPLRMPDLERIAKLHGFDPAKLWPWYRPAAIARAEAG